MTITKTGAETVDLDGDGIEDLAIGIPYEDVGPVAEAGVARIKKLLPAADYAKSAQAARANAIAGCAIVYTVQVGGPAAAKLVARRIHPMKTVTEIAIAERHLIPKQTREHGIETRIKFQQEAIAAIIRGGPKGLMP